MASGTRISNAVAKAMLDTGIKTSLDAGAGNGIINIYTGAAPTNVEDAATGTLLGTLVCSKPSFPAATDQNPGARITASAITNDSSADASGTAGYFRAYTTTGGTDATKVTGIIQGTAGIAADTTDLTLDDKVIVIGGTIACTSWIINQPEL